MSKEQSKVSLIVTSHNQLKYSKIMYESLKKYTHYPYELIWVDSDSTDGTRDWLRSDEHKNTISVFVPSMGIGEAMNIGFAKCSGDSKYIGDLDNDLVLTENWLTRLVEHMEVDKKIAACQPMWQRAIIRQYPTRRITNRIDHLIKRKLKFIPEIWWERLWYALWLVGRPFEIGPSTIHSVAQEIKNQEGVRVKWWVSGSHTLYRREALEDVGLWDPRFWVGEDKDIGVRLSAMGWMSTIALNAVVYHFQGITTDVIEETDPEWNKHRIESKKLLDRMYSGVRLVPNELSNTSTRRVGDPSAGLDGELLTYKNVLARSKMKSDINKHLCRLYKLTTDIPLRKEKVVVELGVRGGESTTALLAAVNDTGGRLISIDIAECVATRERLKDEPNWSFIHGNDMELVKQWHVLIDHLFIDTSHTYEHTLAELREWGRWVKDYGIITLHDTNAPNYPEVMGAIVTYLGENPGFSFVNHPESFGLGIIKKYPEHLSRWEKS